MNRFKSGIRALAASAPVQDALFPDFVAKGDKLVLDYSAASLVGAKFSVLSRTFLLTQLKTTKKSTVSLSRFTGIPVGKKPGLMLKV